MSISASHNQLLPIRKRRTIVTQRMDEAVCRWLNYFGIGEFQWFFNGLSYIELLHVDESNFHHYLAKFNICCMSTPTVLKICSAIREVRNRPLLLRLIAQVIF